MVEDSMVEDVISIMSDLLRVENEVRRVGSRLESAAKKVSEHFKSKLHELAKELELKSSKDLSLTVYVDGKIKQDGFYINVSTIKIRLEHDGSAEISFTYRTGTGPGSIILRSDTTRSITIPLTSMNSLDLVLLMENKDEIRRMLREALDKKKKELKKLDSLEKRVLEEFSEILAT